jgi:hypothetical protein
MQSPDARAVSSDHGHSEAFGQRLDGPAAIDEVPLGLILLQAFRNIRLDGTRAGPRSTTGC